MGMEAVLELEFSRQEGKWKARGDVTSRGKNRYRGLQGESILNVLSREASGPANVEIDFGSSVLSRYQIFRISRSFFHHWAVLLMCLSEFAYLLRGCAKKSGHDTVCRFGLMLRI